MERHVEQTCEKLYNLHTQQRERCRYNPIRSLNIVTTHSSQRSIHNENIRHFVIGYCRAMERKQRILSR